MLKEIQSIVDSGDSVFVKSNQLDSLKCIILKEINDAKIEIKRQKKVCTMCKREYNNEDWEITYKKAQKVVKLSYSDEDTEAYEYETRTCQVRQETCPAGHKFEIIIE